MSFDARGMIDVNLDRLTEAARDAVVRGVESPVVLSVATWGRGCRQSTLAALEPYRYSLGFNGSLVAVVPSEVAAQLFEVPELTHRAGPPDHFRAVGVAYKECFWEWLPLQATS